MWDISDFFMASFLRIHIHIYNFTQGVFLDVLSIMAYMQTTLVKNYKQQNQTKGLKTEKKKITFTAGYIRY